MEKPPYLMGYLEKKGDKGFIKAWSKRFCLNYGSTPQEGANLYYYEDKHFRSTSDAHGFIDLTTIVSVDAVAPAQKKDKAKMISIGTNLGRTFLLREPNDDVRKAEEWVSRLDSWRKWIKDGGSSSPPLPTKHQAEMSRNSSVAEIKPMARGLSGAVERSKMMMKKSVRGVGTLVTTTVAKSKGDEGDDEVEGIKKCGWMVKKGQRRWFALHDGQLMWFKDAQSSANTVNKDNAAGYIPLIEGCVVRRVQEKPSLVVISPSGKPYELVALDNGSRDVWLNYLTDACGGARARAPTIQVRAPLKLKGWLKRKTGPGKMKPWKKVYVVQEETELVFYASDEPSQEPLGNVNLFEITNVDVTYEDGVSPTFEVRTANVVHYLCALSEEDLEYWTTGLARFWENKKARGSARLSKDLGKKQQPAPPSQAPRPVSQDIEAPAGVSRSLIDPSQTEEGYDEDMGEEERQAKLLAALQDSSDDEDGVPGSAVFGDATKGENDEEFDSLMSALGSEQVKLRQSAQKGKSKPVQSSMAEWNEEDDDDDESMNEMLAVAGERAKKNRKEVTIQTGVQSPKLRAGDDGTDKRIRSRTEIQRRLQAKEKELAGGSGRSPDLPPRDRTKTAARLEEKKRELERAEAAKNTAAAAPVDYDNYDNDDDDDDDDDDQELLDSVVLSSVDPERMSQAQPRLSGQKQSQKLSESGSVIEGIEDEFDVLGAIPSFDFSDEEVAAPKKKAPAKEKKPVARSEPVDFDNDDYDDDDDIDDEVAAPPPPPDISSSEEDGLPPMPGFGSKIEAKKAAPQQGLKKEKKKIRVRRAKQNGPWVVDDRVMAQFEDDELWYKARVTKVVEEDMWKVEFIEYGNSQVCDEDMILGIPEEDLTSGDEIEVTESSEGERFPTDDEDEDLPPVMAATAAGAMSSGMASGLDPAEDAFSKELDSMLSLPPKPSESSESDEEDDLPTPAPPDDYDDDDYDDDDDDAPALPPPVQEEAEDWEVSNDDDDEGFEVPAPVLKKASPKTAAVDADGPNYDKCGLFSAASKGDLKTVKAILAEGKVPIDYQKRKEPRGWSALHFAVQAGQAEIVAFLLKSGADIHLVDAREKTVMHKALGETSKPAIVSLLLEHGANVFAISDTGDTILHDARNYESVQLVLESLQPNEALRLLGEHGQEGHTPLHRAAADGALAELCGLYLEHDPECIDVEDMMGETPLFRAVRHEALQCIALLLEGGASLEATNQRGMTVFHVALSERKELALELLMAGALVTEQLVVNLVDEQLDRQLEDEEEEDQDSEEELLGTRVHIVAKYLRMLRRSFSRKGTNPFRQVLAALRLGEEYLRAAEFYHHALILLNAAQGFCLMNHEGAVWDMLAEAVRWQIGLSMKKARYAKGDRRYAKLSMSVEDEFEAFQQRHYSFLGSVTTNDEEESELRDELRALKGCDENGFPADIMTLFNRLFEEEWE